jgi:hypothetical protein
LTLRPHLSTPSTSSWPPPHGLTTPPHLGVLPFPAPLPFPPLSKASMRRRTHAPPRPIPLPKQLHHQAIHGRPLSSTAPPPCRPLLSLLHPIKGEPEPLHPRTFSLLSLSLARTAQALPEARSSADHRLLLTAASKFGHLCPSPSPVSTPPSSPPPPLSVLLLTETSSSPNRCRLGTT